MRRIRRVVRDPLRERGRATYGAPQRCVSAQPREIRDGATLPVTPVLRHIPALRSRRSGRAPSARHAARRSRALLRRCPGAWSPRPRSRATASGAPRSRTPRCKGGDIARDAHTGTPERRETLGLVPRAAAAGTATTAQASAEAQHAASATRRTSPSGPSAPAPRRWPIARARGSCDERGDGRSRRRRGHGRRPSASDFARPAR